MAKNDVSKISDLVKNHYGKIKGVVDFKVVLRRINIIVINIFFDEDVFARAKEDMIYPADLGLKFKKVNANAKKYPRLFLEEMKAEQAVKKEIRRRRFHVLKVEWVTFLRDVRGRVTSVQN